MRMQKMLLAVITVWVSLVTGSFAADNSPVGYWKTIDDLTGKPKSIVHVWRNQQQMLMAKVVKLYSSSAQTNQTKVCTACKGDNHNQPIVGMVIMSGLRATNNQWTNGEILDPANGKTYRCSARLTENGKKLKVRGFIGLPMFGRSQTWERVDLMSG